MQVTDATPGLTVLKGPVLVPKEGSGVPLAFPEETPSVKGLRCLHICCVQERANRPKWLKQKRRGEQVRALENERECQHRDWGGGGGWTVVGPEQRSNLV